MSVCVCVGESVLLNMNECMNGTANALGQWATEEGEQQETVGTGKGGRKVARGIGSQCNGACCMLHAARRAICHSVAVTVAAGAVVATAWPTHRQSLIVVYYYHTSCCCCCCCCFFWSCHCATATTNDSRPFFVRCHAPLSIALTLSFALGHALTVQLCAADDKRRLN